MLLQSNTISPSNVIILSSVLFLIVIELSDTFHQEDLHKKAADNDYQRQWKGYFGVFTLVHVMNFAILSIGFWATLSVVITSSQRFFYLLATIYFVMLGLLPFLEIGDYEKHVKGEEWQPSYFHHVVHVLATILGIGMIEGFALVPHIWGLAGATVGGLLVIYGTLFGPIRFLATVQKEYNRKPTQLELKDYIDSEHDDNNNPT